MNELINKR